MVLKRLWSLLAALFLGLVGTFAQNCPNGDCDQDGISDALEAAIAQRFAPQWRFNRFQPGDGSEQNNNEKNYPISVEKWFDQEAADGDPPIVASYYTVQPPPDPITQLLPPPLHHVQEQVIHDIRELDAMVNPLNHEPLTSENLVVEADDVPFSMQIEGFPKDQLGDPDNFPTYYHCYERGGTVYISYMLFYAYDEKSMPGDLADHRTDWAGINIRLTGIGTPELLDPNAVSDASIVHVWYGGHTKSYILPTNPEFHSIGDHPQVYVSRGSHTCWPRPGEWHDYDVENSEWGGVIVGALTYLTGLGFFGSIFGGWGVDDFADSADDMFRGDGLVVESWAASRDLVNLGESAHDDATADLEGIPLTGWGDFNGFMGPDFLYGFADSPGPPYSKGEWLGGMGPNVLEWSALVDSNPGYLDDFEPVNTSSSAGWHATSGSPEAVIWSGEKFGGEPWVVSGPGVFPDISELVYNQNGGTQYYVGLSVLFAGRLRIKLYPGYNFEGSPVTITRSKHKVSGIFRSMVIEDYLTGETCDMTVNASASGPEDGSVINPYNTIQEAVDAVPNNGYICIHAGSYPEALNFNGPVHLRAQGGIVHLGQ